MSALSFFVCQVLPSQTDIVISLFLPVPVIWLCVNKRKLWYLAEEDLQPLNKQDRTKYLIIVDRCSSLFVAAYELPRCNVRSGATKLCVRSTGQYLRWTTRFLYVLSFQSLFSSACRLTFRHRASSI